MQEKILVTRSSMPSLDEYVHEIESLWDSHWLTNMGAKHELLREELKKYLKVDAIDLLTNGHMALELVLQILNMPKGGEVITTPFTFASTTHAIVRNGLVPVFCDINPDTYTIDASKIESLITDNTVAIVPVHVYGNICDIEKIDEIAKRHHLKVVYDAAHAFGETYNDRGIGSFGDASIFSFHATKVFNTIEGGAVCTKDKALIDKMFVVKDFGILDQERVTEVGPNAKMNEFCAAMGLCNLRHLDEEIEKRKKVVGKYRNLLSSIPGIKICNIQDGVKSNYSYLPIVVDEKIYGKTRDDLYEYLDENGVGARKYFYPLTCDFECFDNQFNCYELPVARFISERVLTLPLYADLPVETVEMICRLIGDFS